MHAIPNQCLNCKEAFHDADEYCRSCGQARKDIDVTLWQLLSEFFSSVFAVKGKLLSTGKSLLFSPGSLTLDFMQGKRIGFISPIKLYLWCSVIYFLTLSLTINLHPIKNPMSNMSNADANYNLNLGTASVNMKGREIVELANSTEAEFQAYLAKKKIAPNSMLAFFLRRAVKIMADGGIDKLRQTATQVFSNLSVIGMPILGILCYLAFFKRVRNFVHAMVFSAHVHAFGYLAMTVGVVIGEITDAKFSRYWCIPFVLIYLIIAARNAFPHQDGTPVKWLSFSMLYVILASIALLALYGVAIIFLAVIVALTAFALM